MTEDQRSVRKMLGMARILEEWNARWANPTEQQNTPNGLKPMGQDMSERRAEISNHQNQ